MYFLTERVLFLGYVVSKDGISVDQSKLDAIRDWPTPTTLSAIRSFHGLVSFFIDDLFLILVLLWHQSRIA